VLTKNIFLGLGANLGDRFLNIQSALSKIHALRGTEILRRSSLYETAPVGFLQQDEFLNMVVEIATVLSPNALLGNILAIETELGRIRFERWGPRVIDIDILYWGNTIMQTPDLIIPHPEAAKRRFVLEPLCEIAPEFRAPPYHKMIRQMRDDLDDMSEVKLVESRTVLWKS